MNGQNRTIASNERERSRDAVWFARGLGLLVVVTGLGLVICCISNNKDDSWELIPGIFFVAAGLGVSIPEAQTYLGGLFRSALGAFRTQTPEKAAESTVKTPSGSAPPPAKETEDLPHVESPLPTLGEMWTSVSEARQPIFDLLGPTYFLDDTYHFLDWNPTFDELLAKPLGLKRGWHAATFVQRLKNVASVVERSKKTFGGPEPPLVDIEVLEFESEKYGLIYFKKIAAQIADEHGGIRAWSVNLNILKAEDGAKEEALWKDLEDRLHREVNWSKYALSYDNLLLNFDEYLKLRDKIVEEVGDAKTCIDVGAGTGNGTLKLLETKEDREVWAVDYNETMLQFLKEKAEQHPNLFDRLVILKEDIQRLEEYPEENFDAAIMINVLYSVDDRQGCLKQVYRLLKPGGRLVLSTSNSQTDIGRLFGAMRANLEEKDKWEELNEDWRHALQRHQDMEALIHHDTLEDIRGYVENAGFTIKKWMHPEYVGAVVIVVAEK